MPIPRTRKKPGRKKTRRTENLLHLFAALLRRKRPLSIDTIAQIAGCSVRTAYRLIEEMRVAGLVRGGGGNGYSLHLPGARRAAR